MTDFNITIEKIARKWVTLKVQNKKDSTKHYTGYALKENVLKFAQNAQIGDTLHVFANCNKIEDSFKTRYEFEIKLLAVSTNEKVNGLIANLLSKKDFTVSNVVDTRINIHYEKEYCYDEQLEELLSQARVRQEQANKEKAEKYWRYTLENYNEGKGYIYQLGIDIMHQCGDHSHDEEIEEMKKTISINEMIRKDELEEQERQEKIRRGIKDFAFEYKCQVGSIFIDEDKAYKVLSCHYEIGDGWSVGVMSENWYSVEAQDVSNTEKGKEELSKYHEKLERDKKAKELEKAKRESLEKIYDCSKKEIAGEHHISEFTNDAVVVFNTFSAYGTGEKITVKGGTVYFITNNGMDGDRWDINNIRTGGAGAYGSQAVLTKTLADKINNYLELCEREERVEYMQTEEITVQSTGQIEKEETMENRVENQEVLSVEYSQAIALNHKIKVNSTVMVNVMYELGTQLMEMRDKKLFKELGYKSFKDYIASEVPLARTQSYACITIAENLSEEFVRSSEQIGVKKLEILARLDEPQREQLQETVNLEDITVKQLQEEVKKLKSENAELKETVSSTNDLVVSVQNANAVLKAQNSEKVKALNEQIEKLENQVKELENRPIEVAVKEDTETSREISNLKREIKAREESIKRLTREYNQLEDDMTTATQNAYKQGLEASKNDSNQDDDVFTLVTENLEDAFYKYFNVVAKNKNPRWAERIKSTLQLFDDLKNESLGEKSNE